jgi:uncharacterized repeat protein (TIGR01451 family)
MKHSRKSNRSTLATILAGFGLLTPTGCGTMQLNREPDHVYSTTTPQMMEQRASGQSMPVQARYADEQTTAATEASVDSPEGRVHLSPVQRAVATSRGTHSEGGFILASYQADDPRPDGDSESFLPAEPRLEMDSIAPSNRMETVAASPLAELYPDEYVFDGGDRENPADMFGAQRSGLNSEDTVAAFFDHTGTARTAASNRVAVYAPRFGSVRTVTGLVADIKVDRVAGARDNLAVGNLKTGRAAQENIHGTVLYGLETRNRVDGMQSSSPPMEARRTDNAGESRKVDGGLEGRSFAGSDSMHRNQGPILSQQIQNAIIWTRDQFPVISASTASAGEISAKFKVQQTVGVEDERKSKGNIRIIKLADRELAQSGDTVRFNIRFENTGDFDVYDVVIVDNLTPRLEYVSGSAQIDARNPGEVEVEPNGEGSSVLSFRLDQPLKGHSGGTITFEAIVR